MRCAQLGPRVRNDRIDAGNTCGKEHSIKFAYYARIYVVRLNGIILDIRLHIANAIDQLLEACRAFCVVCILSISEVAGRAREAL